jgi:hypothetical protein
MSPRAKQYVTAALKQNASRKQTVFSRCNDSFEGATQCTGHANAGLTELRANPINVRSAK